MPAVVSRATFLGRSRGAHESLGRLNVLLITKRAAARLKPTTLIARPEIGAQPRVVLTACPWGMSRCLGHDVLQPWAVIRTIGCLRHTWPQP